MFILDTDVVVHLQSGHEQLTARIGSVPEFEIYTTIITKVEILRERFEFLLKASDSSQLQRAQNWLNDSEKQLADMAMLTITIEVAEHFEKLRVKRGLGQMRRADLLIACFALAHDAVLVTRNTKDLVRIPNLRLENWLDD